MTIRLYKSNGLAAGDCLGGWLSRTPLEPLHIYTIQDQCECLEISNLQLALGGDVTRAEFEIVKSGDTFTITLSYPQDGVGWNDVAFTPFDLTVGQTEEVTSTFTSYTIYRKKTGMDGTMIFRTLPGHNTPLGGDNVDVADGTVYQYGCMYLVADGDTVVDDIQGGQVLAHVQVALDTPGVMTQTIADRYTAPTGIVFANSIAAIGTITDGTIIPLWWKAESTGSEGLQINTITFTSPLESMNLVASHFRYDDTILPYRLYGAYDGSTAGGTLLGEFDTLPASVALSIPPVGDRDYRLRVVSVNEYGIESQNQSLNHFVTIDDGGDDVTVPQTPSSVALTFTTGGHAQLSFAYALEIANPVIFAVTEINGESHYVEIFGAGTYSAITDEPVTWGDEITATVYFIDNRGRTSATVSVSEYAEFSYNTRPDAIIGRIGGFYGDHCTPSNYALLSDGDATIMYEPGGTSFYYGGVLQFEVIPGDVNEYELYIPGWTLANEAVAGAQVGILEDDGAGIAYLAYDGTRCVKIDTVNKIISTPTWEQPFAKDCGYDDVTFEYDSVLYFQTIAPYGAGALPWIAIDGTLTYITAVNQIPEGT